MSTSLRQLADELGIVRSAGCCARISAYLDAMLDENQRVNLTAVRDPETAMVLHALDSLAIAMAQLDPPELALDLGTGNGFPGVAVAALWPDARVLLCDRTKKKTEAIGRALDTADLRAETLWLDAAQAPALHPDLAGACDLITARAVAEPRAVSQLARPLLRRGGHLALWLAEDTDAPSQLVAGMPRIEVVEYELPEPAARARRLAIYQR